MTEEQKVREPTDLYLVGLQSLKYTLKHVSPNIETNALPIAQLLPEKNAAAPFIKGSLMRDFQLLVSFTKQFLQGPEYHSGSISNFLQKFVNIFECKLLTPVNDTDTGDKRQILRQRFSIFC